MSETRVANAAEEPRWDKVIVPQRKLLSIPFRELGQYKDLIWLMAKRNLTAQYKQTIFGPSWFVLQPLLATVVFSFLFGRMAGLGTDKIPHFLFYMAGIVTWGFFSETVIRTAATFTRNAHIFGKIYFPRMVVPLAQLITNFAGFLVQFSVFLIGLGFYWVKMVWFADPHVQIAPNWRMALLPVFLLQIGMVGVGTGLIVASLTTRYKDLQMAVGFGVQLWMYGSSVVFPLSRITDETYRFILTLNPMVPVIEGFRFAFLGEGTVTKVEYATSFGISAFIFLVGLVMFSRTEQTVMDTV
jgi:lipopolysaccharide transport system permease protein